MRRVFVFASFLLAFPVAPARAQQGSWDVDPFASGFAVQMMWGPTRQTDGGLQFPVRTLDGRTQIGTITVYPGSGQLDAAHATDKWVYALYSPSYDPTKATDGTDNPDLIGTITVNMAAGNSTLLQFDQTLTDFLFPTLTTTDNTATVRLGVMRGKIEAATGVFGPKGHSYKGGQVEMRGLTVWAGAHEFQTDLFTCVCRITPPPQ